MKKENIKLSITLLLIITISLIATYAYLTMGASNNITNTAGGCFVVNYTGQSINNLSLQSNANYEEGAQSEITLSKNKNCEIYTKASIYIHTNTEETTIPFSEVQAMKYQVMQGTEVVSSGTIDGSEDQKLTEVDLTETATAYTIYLWIDPAISQGAYNGKSYSGYFYANSTQTSTVTE